MNKMNILFVGIAGVPYTMRAADVRLTSFANLLSKQNLVTILNRFSINSIKEHDNGQLSTDVKILEIIKSKRLVHIFPERLLFFLSILMEPFKILSLNKTKKINILHIYTEHFFDFILYRFIALIIGAKIVYQYVEYRSAFSNQGLYHRINAFFCDKYGAKIWNGAICISSFLCVKVKSVNSNIPIIKIPPLCDFEVFKGIKKKNFEKPFLLYCGTAAYIDVIKFIIDAYHLSKINEITDLVLVVNGTEERLEEVRKYSSDVVLLSKLKYTELISYYKTALALLIPMRPVVSDIARFPNKICEYLASKGLIVSTNLGEITYYFQDNDNALVADDYDVKLFAEKLNLLVDMSDRQIKIMRNRSYEIGLRYFDHNSYDEKLTSFLRSL